MSVKWVAVGFNTSLPTNTILWSSDGQTWNDASSGGFGGGGGYGIAYDGNNWVASGSGSFSENSIQWSPNGKDWYDASSGGFTGGDGQGGVAYGNGNGWVAVGYTSGTNSIQWSPDGRTWQDASSGGFLGGGGYYSGVAYDGKGLWVACGLGTSARNSIQWSPDGRTWFDASRGGFDDGGGGNYYCGQGIAYDGNKWIAVGYGSSDQNTIQWSPDGLSWYDVSGGGFVGGGGEYNGNGIASDGKGNWVAVGEGSSPENSILWSPDGLTWQDASNGFDEYYYGAGIAYDGGKWVAVGEGTTPEKTILWSLDGRTWFDASSGGFGTLYGLAIASTRLLPPNPGPLPCFLQGTHILTPAGYKKVEEIESGEYVLTSDNRKVKASLYRFTISTTEETAPYTIQAGALGGIPSRDLHISGNHAVQDSTGAWQIPKFLAKKNPRITQHALGKIVTYYHVECEHYFKDNLVAEGVVAESYNHSKQSVVWKKSARGYVRRQEDRKDWWRAVKS